MINMKRELVGVNHEPVNYTGCTIVDGIIPNELVAFWEADEPALARVTMADYIARRSLQARINAQMYEPRSVTLNQGETLNLTTMQVTRK